MIKLSIVGCGPAFAIPSTPSSGYLMETGDTALLVDCGHGIGSSLLALKDLDRVSGILISHMHPDHFFDIVPLTYAYKHHGLPAIPLWLPPGGRETVQRLQSAVGLQDNFFTDTFHVMEYDPAHSLEFQTVRVRFAETRHFIPAWAMRFEEIASPEHVLLYSSDTGWTQAVIDLATGAKLAVVEATLDIESPEDEHEGHMTAGAAAALARTAGVETLVLTHYPPEDGQQFLAEAREVFGPQVTLALPGAEYEV